MKTIWKYALDLRDDQYLEVPEEIEILSVGVQNGSPFIWALVDSECAINSNHAQKTVRIIVVPTGVPTDVDGMEFVGTFQIAEGTLVFHVFVREIRGFSFHNDDDDE